MMLQFLCRTLPHLVWDAIRLTCLVICLAPGFVRFVWYYAVASNRISVRFGTVSCRQTLDVYTLKPILVKPKAAATTTLTRTSTSTSTTDVDDQEDEHDNHDTSTSVPLVQAPVVIFFTGGAWMIGYKMWGTLLARALTAVGVVVVIPDMRNYPLGGTVPDMVQDVDLAIQWTLDNIANYGGDPTKIVIAGQSAGGHVACVALLRRAIQECLSLQQTKMSSSAPKKSILANNPSNQATATTASSRESSTSNTYTKEDDVVHFQNLTEGTNWRPADLKGFLSLSSPFSLVRMEHSFERHGLDADIVGRIFGSERNKDLLDPYKMILEYHNTHHQQQLQKEKENTNYKDNSNIPLLKDHLPPFRIYHGTLDKTVPHEGSVEFSNQLETVLNYNKMEDEEDLLSSSNPPPHVVFKSYPGWSHTDAILEGPMDADHRFHMDLFQAVKEWTDSPNLKNWSDMDPLLEHRLCPHVLVEAARFCNPF